MTARAAIADAGGLVSTVDLAARWRISRQRALQLTRHPDFPEPVYTSSSDRPLNLWLAAECDDFRSNRYTNR